MQRIFADAVYGAAASLAIVAAYVAVVMLLPGQNFEIPVFGDKTGPLVGLFFVVPAGCLVGILGSERFVQKAKIRTVAAGIGFLGALAAALFVVVLMAWMREGMMAFAAPIIVPMAAAVGYRVGLGISPGAPRRFRPSGRDYTDGRGAQRTRRDA